MNSEKKMIFAWFCIIFLVGEILFSGLATGAVYSSYGSTSFRGTTTSYSGSTYQAQPAFQTYYGADSRLTTYWPILANKETCEARQDFLLNIAPAGCQPAVVRSDLLEEQNVPVFCQIDAIKVNPLLDIDQIKSMTFRGNYPPEVVGAGFHPARAALRTHDILVGSPLINNVGYVVVVLKRQPNEDSMPDFVNLTLSARLQYHAGNAFGVGRSEFVLESLTDEEWSKEKYRQSFMNGRYFIRLEQADIDYATVSIYYGTQKISTVRIKKGDSSNVIYLPGMYCRAGFKLSYTDFITAEPKAQIEVSSSDGEDVFDVYRGSRFLDGKCVVDHIDVDEMTGETGNVSGSCGSQRFILTLQPRSTELFSMFIGSAENVTPEEKPDGSYSITFTKGNKNKQGTFELDSSDNLGTYVNSKFTTIIYYDGTFNESAIGSRDKEWLSQLRSALIEYKRRRTADPQFSIGAFADSSFSQEAMQRLRDTIATYEQIADDYPAEKRNSDISGQETYGEQALQYAIKLAEDYGLDSTRRRLIEKFAVTYPDSDLKAGYLESLNGLERMDTSLSGVAIDFDDKTRGLRLVSVSNPRRKADAKLYIDQKPVTLSLNSPYQLVRNDGNFGNISIEEIRPTDVRIRAVCSNYSDGRGGRYQIKLNDGPVEVCGLPIQLDFVNAERVAKISIQPQVQNAATETNLSVWIGIEKRAIKLNPDETSERIARLNETINKWQSVSDKLGKIITGLKAACFATATVLTLKNFMTGLSGETIARQDVMGGEHGWRNKCKDLVGKGEYVKIDECYTKNADKIDADVSRRTDAIQKVNEKIEAIQNKYKTSTGLFGDSVDTDKVKAELAATARRDYAGTEIRLKDGTTVTMDQLMSAENVKNDYVSIEAIRSAMLSAEVKKTQGISADEKKNVDSRLTEIAELVGQNKRIDAEMKRSESMKQQGFPQAFFASTNAQQTRLADVVPITGSLKGQTGNQLANGTTHLASVIVPATTIDSRSGKQYSFSDGTYLLGLKEADARSGMYTVTDILKYDPVSRTYSPLPEDQKGTFLNQYGVGAIRSEDRIKYNNEIAPQDRYVRYYENEPYKGMPAIVPFEIRQGWYAATKQTIPTFGGIGAYDSSGKVSSFWVCNVGDNHRIEFEEGLGDDLCLQVNTATGQSNNYFPGLDQEQSKQIIQKGMQAIQDAATQYGKSQKFVKINGQSIEVGRPTAGQPGTTCADFMSPKDCLLLFNICDPVICPSSRCDLGGQYPVADVVQTGIIGSIVLCFPNIREGIMIPVCLTGIQAGIDGLISIMKNYRDCLIENLKTGKMIGICDQIYSIYLCEFFWRQVAPFAKLLIPTIIASAYGQGTRGGAEYLTVMNSWQNMENSISYFTQSYAANSFKSFKVQSIEEAGTEVCKAFISGKLPDAFSQLIEPESPAQYYAWFDATRMTDATVPATSQYKVFYHIYAGKDEGAYYSVSLRNPPQSSYYSMTDRIQVASGFIPAGQYASETKDFSAPEGYKEVCIRVNENEECGFKQVSTDFAVNYLRDQYVSDQMKQTTITSEKECVAGSADVGAFFANTNPQSALEEAAMPDIYNRGVVRICASQNPGSASDPSRFVDVGYCDQPKMRCWLDKTSVDNAITANNLGVKNATLEVLENRTSELLSETGDVIPWDVAEAEIYSLEEALGALVNSNDKINDAQKIIDRINLVFPKLVLNSQKANILLIKGRAQEIVVRDSLQRERVERDKQRQSSVVLTNTEISRCDATNNVPPIFEGNVPKLGTENVYQVSFSNRVTNYVETYPVYGIITTNGQLVQWDFNDQKWKNVDIAAESDAGKKQYYNDLRNALIQCRQIGSTGTTTPTTTVDNVSTTSTLPSIFQGKTPRYDGEWLTIDFGGSVGKYALTKENGFQWHNGTGWINADVGSTNYNAKSADDKKWITDLKQALIDYRAAHPLQSGTSTTEDKTPAVSVLKLVMASEDTTSQTKTAEWSLQQNEQTSGIFVREVFKQEGTKISHNLFVYVTQFNCYGFFSCNAEMAAFDVKDLQDRTIVTNPTRTSSLLKKSESNFFNSFGKVVIADSDYAIIQQLNREQPMFKALGGEYKFKESSDLGGGTGIENSSGNTSGGTQVQAVCFSLTPDSASNFERVQANGVDTQLLVKTQDEVYYLFYEASSPKRRIAIASAQRTQTFTWNPELSQADQKVLMNDVVSKNYADRIMGKSYSDLKGEKVGANQESVGQCPSGQAIGGPE